MATNRYLVFANDQIYHVFNRGVERRLIFTNKREYQRAVDTIWYYRYGQLPMRLSEFFALSKERKTTFLAKLEHDQQLSVSILGYCLMPNHFHFIIKQLRDAGVSNFAANVANSYTKYFNTRHKRIGHLFQGPFKAVRVETDEQLLHLTRYVHLNPFVSFVVKLGDLESYPWSSFSEYLGKTSQKLCDTGFINGHFSTIEKYRQFVFDQADYGQKLEQIEHLCLEE